MSTFRIQETEFEANVEPRDGSVLRVESSPRPYQVDFGSARPLSVVIDELLSKSAHPVVLADRKPLEAHLGTAGL